MSQPDSIKLFTYSEIINSMLRANPKEAAEYVGLQSDLAEKLKKDWAEAEAKMTEGNFFAATNDYEKAEEAYEIAKSIFEKRSDSLQLSKCLNNLARPLVEQGKYEKALTNSIKALKINEILGEDKSMIIGNYMAIGNIHSVMGSFDKSLEYYKMAENIALDEGLTFRLAQVRHNIGSNMMWLKRNKDAIDYFEQNLAFFEEAKNQLRIAITLTSMGANYFEMDSIAKAKPCFERSLRIAEKLGNPEGAAHNARNLGRIAMKENNPKKALNYYTIGMNTSLKTNSNGILAADYNNISSAYLAMSDYKNAYHYFEKHKKLSDSLLNVENTKKLNELEIQYQTEKREAEIALQDEEIKTLNEKAKVDKLTKGIYAGGMASALALSGLLVFGFRQRIKKNQIAREKQEEIYKQEIAHKKKELASQTLHLVQKNTFIQELMENLQNIKNDPERFKVEFRRIVMLLKKENASDKDWEVFKTYFAEVHNDFDQKLKTLYPDISEKEIRLAAFLRMNLTTKEIAATLNVLPDSILKSKYRLKKKLGLDKETDLTSFLNGL
ncbi:tetratricopeptide repeat protein [Flagellimonas allohymeniacidonis]|uniref:tetratricopeptide repeat protein n=1 Tax=Flagellimonas allohymeniacidonis TaxID=2517819 RepID=UPI0013EE553B|nr:tetratricopeptide repeat protein [Allomuricauda hymeniacidonis]